MDPVSTLVIALVQAYAGLPQDQQQALAPQFAAALVCLVASPDNAKRIVTMLRGAK